MLLECHLFEFDPGLRGFIGATHAPWIYRLLPRQRREASLRGGLTMDGGYSGGWTLAFNHVDLESRFFLMLGAAEPRIVQSAGSRGHRWYLCCLVLLYCGSYVLCDCVSRSRRSAILTENTDYYSLYRHNGILRLSLLSPSSSWFD
jgi:hypothetical protein